MADEIRWNQYKFDVYDFSFRQGLVNPSDERYLCTTMSTISTGERASPMMRSFLSRFCDWGPWRSVWKGRWNDRTTCYDCGERTRIIYQWDRRAPSFPDSIQYDNHAHPCDWFLQHVYRSLRNRSASLIMQRCSDYRAVGLFEGTVHCLYLSITRLNQVFLQFSAIFLDKK